MSTSVFRPNQRVVIRHLPADIVPTSDTGVIIRQANAVRLPDSMVVRFWHVLLDGVNVLLPIPETDLMPFAA